MTQDNERDTCETHCWAAPGLKCYRCGRTGKITLWWSLRQRLVHLDLEPVANGILLVGFAAIVVLLWMGFFVVAFFLALATVVSMKST